MFFTFGLKKVKLFIKCSGDNMKYKCLEKLGINNETEKKGGKVIRFVNKVLMAVFLGLVALIVMEYSPKFKTFMHEEVLDKNISFGFLNNLYDKYFGKVLPKNEDNVLEVFNEKISFSKKEDYNNGYKLTVSNNYLVPVMSSGVIVFIGEKEDFGKVVVIEGEDGSTITYGNIKNTSLKLYDYASSGTFLGEADGDTLYIMIVKNGEYQNIETYLS